MPRFYRKVIRITAEDSPNVKYGLAQKRLGITPTDEMLVPGVLSYGEYEKRRATWNPIQQAVGLDGVFYEGKEIKLYPQDWLSRSYRRALELVGSRKREAKAIGIDPAEGGDRTAMIAVDELGVIEIVSKKTADTNVITGEALAFMRKYNVPPSRVVFDRGGGGKQHADRLRAQGFAVRTVGFGEAISIEPRRGLTPLSLKKETREDRTAYRNRRAEMYWELRELLDPEGDVLDSKRPTFAIPWHQQEPGRKTLAQQMEPIPLTYDDEGKFYVMPKNKKEGETKKTLIDLIGHSPDELDALVLAVHGMIHKDQKMTAGVPT